MVVARPSDAVIQSVRTMRFCSCHTSPAAPSMAVQGSSHRSFLLAAPRKLRVLCTTSPGVVQHSDSKLPTRPQSASSAHIALMASQTVKTLSTYVRRHSTDVDTLLT